MVNPEGFVTFNLLVFDKETKDKVFGMIGDVSKANKYFILGEEDVNIVIHMTKGDPVNEDYR